MLRKRARLSIQDRWRESSELLDEGLASAGPECDAWLCTLRSLDPKLAPYIADVFSEQRVLAQAGILDGRVFSPSGRPTLVGHTVGIYRLLSQLGQGGTSSVWLAERADRTLGRRVAIKLLNFALIATSAEAQLGREATILNLLNDSHIVRLIDTGVWLAGQPYLVLEYVEGEHIDWHCEMKRLSVQARIRLVLDVLGAVTHAHKKSIVHGDIKPSNVLVRNDGQVKLIDFGISKLLAEGRNADEHALTPEYAAPEQLQGKPVTTATDIFGCGALLYRVLTGQPPFGTGQYSSADPSKEVVAALHARPSNVIVGKGERSKLVADSAARRGITSNTLRSLLGKDLGGVVGKALEDAPKDRYASIPAFADDLCRVLRSTSAGAPIHPHLHQYDVGAEQTAVFSAARQGYPSDACRAAFIMC